MTELKSYTHVRRKFGLVHPNHTEPICRSAMGLVQVSSDNMGRHAVGVLQQCHVSVGKILQSDGAPPHFSRHVLTFLHAEFPDHWIGKG
jgi:hypothetical protein